MSEPRSTDLIIQVDCEHCGKLRREKACRVFIIGKGKLNGGGDVFRCEYHGGRPNWLHRWLCRLLLGIQFE